MIKKPFLSATLILTLSIANSQTNFSGVWAEPELQIVEGIQYSNALPKLIKVAQTKDSVSIERVTMGNDGDVTVTETFPLNGKTVSRVTKTSKRTINTTANWNKAGNILTIASTYSYSEKPGEIEYKNTESWMLDDDYLVITKSSDATVTDDWIIKGTYKRN